MFRALLLLPAFAGMNAAQEKLPYTRLSEYVARVKAAIPGRGANAFREPSEPDRERFTECMRLLLSAQEGSARTCLSQANYSLGVLKDREFHRDYLVAAERQAGTKRLGTYIVDPKYLRNLVLEVPHPLFDRGTLEESLTVFQKTGARGLFIAGTHRCSNLGTPAGCGGSTWACGPSTPPRVSEPYRISDAAHFDRNFFTAAHRALLLLRPQPVAVSVHGNGEEPVDAELSDGTGSPAPPDALVNRFSHALTAHGVKAGSCNWTGDDPSRFHLCGQSNVQGKLSNGATVCTENVRKATGTFLHIEQRRPMRDNPAGLIEAIRQVIPADGPTTPGRRR